MKWEGKELNDAQVIDFALRARGLKRKAFVKKYLSSGEHAAKNIGYLAGYYGVKTAQRILRIFQTEHPIFGKMEREANHD